MKRATWLVAAALVVTAGVLRGEEPTPTPAAQEETSRLTAAGWCAVHKGDPKEDAPGCDAGVGVSLWRSLRWPRLGLAAGVGTKTVGLGGSWNVSSLGERPVAVGLGVIAPYDERGIHVNRWAMALVATFGVGGLR